MILLRQILNCSRTATYIHSSKCLTARSSQLRNSFHQSTALMSLHKKHNYKHVFPVPFSQTMNRHLRSNSSQSQPQTEKDKIALISSHMTMRLLNENSFLSWCRNAYLASVVGIAMMEEATSSLAHTAGFGAFLVGGLNVFWGTSCHVTNLVRLRHASGMSGITLVLNVLGSLVHCVIWLFILVCYIGFLDDPDHRKRAETEESDQDGEKVESFRFRN